MKHQNIEQDVVVPGLQNLSGGCGVAVLVAVGIVAIGGLGVIVALPYAAGAGLVVFGLASAVRAFRDEVTFLTEKHALARNRGEVEALRLQVKYLESELKTAQGRARALEQGDVPEDAAELLSITWKILEDHYNHGLSMSYESCFKRGIVTRGGWDIVHQALVRAGVKDNSGRVLVDNLPEAWALFGQTWGSGARWIKTRSKHLLQVYDNGNR